jgi:hypothetical protein
VPVGIPAVSKSYSMVNGYKVKEVPDHDFPVGSNHKMIPSFYLISEPVTDNDQIKAKVTILILNSRG